IMDGRINLLVQATEPVFGNARDVSFVPAHHRVFDYTASQDIDSQVSSLQMAQTAHRRLEQGPESLEGLLLVTDESGERRVYDIAARPEGVNASILAGATPAPAEAPDLNLFVVF